MVKWKCYGHSNSSLGLLISLIRNKVEVYLLSSVEGFF